MLGPIVERCAGSGRRSRPIRSRRSSRRSPRSRSRCRSAFAMRNAADRALRRRARRAWAFPTRERSPPQASERAGRGRLLPAQGRVRASAWRGAASTSTLSRRSTTTRCARGSPRLRGLGPWTAEWFLARHLARPRAWPAGDLALRKAADDVSTVSTCTSSGPRLDPFQNLSAHYLLAGLVDAAVTIRAATEADEPVLRELWEEFEQEVPLHGRGAGDLGGGVAQTLDDLRAGRVFLAEDGEGVLGVAHIEGPVRGRAHIQLVHVRPRARRQGVAKALLRECARTLTSRGRSSSASMC